MNYIISYLFSPTKKITFGSYFLQVLASVLYYFFYFWCVYNPFAKYGTVADMFYYHPYIILGTLIYAFIAFRTIAIVLRWIHVNQGSVLLVIPAILPYLCPPDDLLGWPIRLWTFYLVFINIFCLKRSFFDTDKK